MIRDTTVAAQPALAGSAPPDHSADLAPLRALLDRAGYTEDGLREILGARELSPGEPGTRAEWLWATRRGTPADTLIRLFLLGVSVARTDAETAVEPTDLRQWEAAGFLEAGAERVRPRVRLAPCRGLMVASDRALAPLEQPPRDYVMGVGSSSQTLANLTIRRPIRAALDLGCGCGIQGLLAAEHSAAVAAADLSPRALAYARLNARLNGIDHMAWREGSFFEAVPGQTYDLIVSNPPFVISPESRYIYRDGGLAGDEVCRSIVRDAPRHLREGGFCQLLCNWAHVRGEDWRERLAGWFAGSGCDAWVMRCETHEPSVYASTWIRHTERGRADVDLAQYDRWMAYYEQAGIEALSAGVITMRRSDRASHWLRADDAPSGMTGPCGACVEQGFALYDFLVDAGREHSMFLDQRLRLSADVLLRTEMAPAEGGWSVCGASLALSRGLVYSHDVGADMAALLARFREPARVQEALADARVPAEALSGCLAELRGLVARGFLTPAASPP